ncbi:hypothetical protein [Dulcicalothrix desertica]|uniref:hypothetical protein n=1 Tax=Dulcicalothrix desertica TaxID=32056 RepID=UPI001648B193|nr:hypothetical protein [Dulcicalothrix desertica]
MKFFQSRRLSNITRDSLQTRKIVGWVEERNPTYNRDKGLMTALKLEVSTSLQVTIW